MRTISVKEAAEALGVSPSAIKYRLENGGLKGTQAKNQYGETEWRVWLSQRHGGKSNLSADAINFEPKEFELAETEEVAYNECEVVLEESPDWRQVEIQRLELIAEKLVKPLAERIEAQAVALREQENIIEEQKRQLLLLPDLQSQAHKEHERAEAEHETAELRALEIEALISKVNVLQAKVQELETPWWKKWFCRP